ncbi:hypothetical protein HFP57_00300 [Parasphingopyxis algicola]|uniref:winged helix-turn-helix domain-containing tetratricopeptide repeat protein n=1 Tax=Parasphingopyxis algicola TaxID=2026624 RepID=UPI0015A35856|nr:winged helix-turn-helix domain-containing protein [Parasphingopyxis algicola]QLC23619.1 hypothetical protein HFP57_00300 [Parasphingopyxis algicola]
MSYHFAEFVLDGERFELRRGGDVVRLQPRAMQLLQLLVSSEGRLLTKQDIFDEVWDGRIVSDSALSSQIKAIRKALGDTEQPFRVIGTVYGKGFRLLADVSRKEPARLALGEPMRAESEPGSIGKRPSIAVLPFRRLGEDNPWSALSEALPDEIITALSRLRLLHVIARGSSFQFPSATTSLATVRRALSVDYCLSGTIEVDGEKLFVTAELADTRSEGVVWAERFEGKIAAIHEIRADIVSAVMSEVELRIPHNEAQRARLIVPDQLTAWQAYHVGMSHIFMRDNQRQKAAERFFEHAIAIDPKFARAHAGLSQVYWWLNIQHLFRNSDGMRERMIDTAKRAIDCDPFDPAANLAMARSTSFEQTQDESLLWLDRTVDICPNYAWGHSQIAAKRSMTGPIDMSVKHAQIALSLSPRDPLRHTTYAALATSNASLGNFDEAAKWGRKVMELPHTDIVAMVGALCANYLAGHEDVSRTIAERIEIVHPGFTTERFVSAHPMMRKEAAARLKDIFSANGIA